MEPLGPQSLDSLWRTQLPQDPAHFPGPQAMRRLPRCKLYHPKRNPPRRKLHRRLGQKQVESLSVELEVGAKVPLHLEERAALRLVGALVQAAVVGESLQRIQGPLLAGLGL